ncbi:hypothetical protein [Endozoicomonas sp. YOMI1]|uniref:hypothetical protein n=1 Tax=Endozoicomonas sp. YOMI1 TaxID=2828739 RepID=UPI002148B621|nr:hypothetical protein [Endozoicomonas sp. YOMI1]
MDRPTISAQLNAASDHSSCLQYTPFSESDASGQAFSRDVVEAAVILCAMRTDETTKKYLQQPTVPFHNPFDDTRVEKRSIASVDNITKEDQLFYLPVRIEPLNNDHAPTYIPENERFSIQPATDTGQSTPQSSSVVDNNPQMKSLRKCKMARERERAREHYQNAPDFAERKKERQRERRRERYQNDPDYAERERERLRMLRKDPVYAKRKRQRARERYQNDPDFAERERERIRVLRRERYQNDPDFAERERNLKRERRRKLRKDPAYLERKMERQRRLRNNTYNMQTATFNS